MSNAETIERFNTYCTYRTQGKDQKTAGCLAGISEKTAGSYERKRMKRLQTTADLITLLEAKAKAKETTAKDLVLLTKEIDRLSDKLQKTRNIL